MCKGTAQKTIFLFLALGATVVGLSVKLSAREVNLVPIGQWPSTGRTPAVWDVFVSGSYAYVAQGEAGLQVIDISDPAAPQKKGGYLTRDLARGVVVSGQHALVAAGAAGLEVIDVTDVFVSGGFAYLTDRNGILEIIDISNPASARRVGRSSAGGLAWTVSVSEKNLAFIADQISGLQIFDVRDPALPRHVWGNSALAPCLNVTVRNDHVYLATGSHGLLILKLVRPLEFDNLRWEQAIFRANLRGPAGLVGRIQRSTNLVQWEDWKVFILGENSFEFSDADPDPTTARFFRAVVR